MAAPEPTGGSIPPTSRVIHILTKYLEELEAGASPNPEDLVALCPELAEPLRGCLRSLKYLQEAVSEQGAVDCSCQADSSAYQDDLPELGRFGDFRLMREVGRGGMGIVYEAKQISLGRRVALKVLPFAATLNARQLQRFKNEAQAAASLHHTNIVPVFGIGCDHGVHYYSMQFIEGQTLAAVITERQRNAGIKNDERGQGKSENTVDQGELPTRASILGPGSSALDPRSSFFKTVASLGIQAAEALDHAHQLGVVHRDVKPANLLLEIVPGVETLRGIPGTFPTGIRLWVTDFGLARLASPGGGDGENLTLTGDLVGTIRYMSPEQTQGRSGVVDHRTDIYSLGVTLYELLTLTTAFSSGNRHELLTQIVLEEPVKPRRLNPAIPPELETIVLKAMAKSPTERYATARELAADLERFLRDEPIRARRPTSIQRFRKWARRHRPTVWSAAAALLVTIAGLAGSIGWVMRDRASGQAKIVADVEAAVKDAQQFQIEGKWPEAQAAAIRARDLLKIGAWPHLATRVQDLLAELADRRLMARLEEIRLLQAADVHAKENRFAQERAIPEYQQAFREFGIQASTITPLEAASLLQARSRAVQAIAVVGLEDWLELTRNAKDPDVRWLEEVLSLADADPWRKSVRVARKSRDRPALERLAREVDVSTQPPQVLILLDRALRDCNAKEGVIALLKRAQKAFPGDFWVNHDLGVALQECQPPQYEEAIRFLTAAEALRPECPGVRLSLGLALSKNGRSDEAIAAFRQAIELKPDYAAAHVNLGSVYMEKGQLDQALDVYRRAAERMPDDLEVQWNLGVTQAGMGQVEEALAAYDRILALKPNFIETHFDPAVQQSLKNWHGQALASLGQLPAPKSKTGAVQGNPTKDGQKEKR